jgi:hypothetical protein
MATVARERSLTDRILSYLNGLGVGVKAVKFHGDEYTEVGTPDILCIAYGTPIWIEVKRKGEEPTPIQYARLRQWKRAGAIVTWVDDLQSVKRLIAKIDAVRTYDDIREQGVEL